MANTITNLIPDILEAIDVVSREIVGFIPAVSTDSTLERVSLNDTVRIPITPAATAADNTPAPTPPDTGDQTIGNVTMTIDNSKHVPIRWNGEQTKGMRNAGIFTSVRAQQMAQGIRTLVNLVETDIASEYLRASRAYGTAGTTPFASTLDDANQIAKILTDNGAPLGDRQLVIDTTAGVKFRNLAVLQQANTAGTDATLRRGVLLPVSGLDVRESAQIQSVTKGTGSAYTTDTSGYAIGDTVITLITGSGTVLAGDVVTFAGDTNKYVVKTGVSAPGAITLAGPGLREAIAASAVAMTIGGNYTANMGFARSAIQLATRMPATPEGGDLAIDSYVVTDPVSGISFEFALYPQFLQNSLHVRLAWGTKLTKPEHTAILLG